MTDEKVQPDQSQGQHQHQDVGTQLSTHLSDLHLAYLQRGDVHHAVHLLSGGYRLSSQAVKLHHAVSFLAVTALKMLSAPCCQLHPSCTISQACQQSQLASA